MKAQIPMHQSWCKENRNEETRDRGTLAVGYGLECASQHRWQWRHQTMGTVRHSISWARPSHIVFSAAVPRPGHSITRMNRVHTGEENGGLRRALGATALT